MIKKFYAFLKKIIIENYLYLLFLLVCCATLTYPLPYYIYNGGGLINVDKKIDFNGKTESLGSYNMCYVSEIRATIPTYLLSLIRFDWERVKIEDVTLNKNETSKDVQVRDRIYLDTGNISAVLNAFKYANKDIKIISNHLVVVYVLEEANNDLKIGDEIVSINGDKVNSLNDISLILDKYNFGDKVNIKVVNKNKEYDRYAYLINEHNRKLLGISIEEKKTIATNPEINFKFYKTESGPSGGLILSLALYDYLIKDDVTKGLKISGTGTIDNDGNVGEIGGIKYKLAGAVKKKADIFFVPKGANYKEAVALKKEKNYKIKVVGVTTFYEAIKYLEDMS